MHYFKIGVSTLLLLFFTSVAQAKDGSPLGWTLDLSNKSVDAIGNMFQDLKNFLALTELKRTQNENTLRYAPPPHVNETVQAGAKLHQGDYWTQALGETLRKNLLNWNTRSDSKTASDSNFVERHLTKYCSRSDLEQGLCHNAKRIVEAPYDLDAGSLWSHSELSNDLQNAAYDFIRNITNPIPVPTLSDEDMFKDKATGVLTNEGLQNLMARYRQHALLSLAQQSFLAMYGERVPYANQGADDGLPPGIKNHSQLTVYEHEVEKRLANPDWYKQMNQMPTEGLLREMANMMALQMSMDLKRYQQMQRIEAMQAAQLAFLAQTIGHAEVARQQANEAEN